MSDSRTANNRQVNNAAAGNRSTERKGANRSDNVAGSKNTGSKSTNGNNTGSRSTGSNKGKRNKKRMEQVVNKGLKSSSGFAFSLLINLIIVFFVVKLFSFAFNFTYSVFGNCVYQPGSTTYKVVEIPADSSIIEIGDALEEAQVIESKYVFFAKVKVKGYGDKIHAGQYGLSASMNLDEILNIICHIETEEEEE